MLKENYNPDDGFRDFERVFMMYYSIVAIIIGFFGIIINALLKFPIELLIMPFFGALVFIGLYFWAKSNKKPFVLKIVLSAASLFVVNYLWYFNYGSHGPAPYFYVIIYSIFVFIWRRKQLLIVSIVLLINLAIIFYIDLKNPYFISDYSSEVARIKDVYSGLLMYGLMLFVLMYSSKNYLIIEYLKAKKSDKLKSAFLANMSHEIRTPMNAIIGFSQMLDDPYLKDSDRAVYIETIHSQGEQLLSFINDIIDISKIESDLIEMKSENVNLNKLCSEVLRDLKNRAQVGVSLKLIVNNNESDLYIMTDRMRMRQVITNLVSNALKYTFEGKVEIALDLLPKNKLSISVKDTGIGIPADDIDKVFGRFYQVESISKDRLNPGTGIGLAITKAIVKQMDGVIELSSTEGVGSLFKVILPYNPGASPILPSVTEKKSELDFPHNKNILVVEDDEMNYYYIKKVIETIKCNSIWVKNGQNAVDYLMENHKVDMILLDMKMPVMDGYEAARTIKKIFPEIPIIAQTAFVLNEDKENALLAGCNEFLAKPIKVNQLRDIMRQYFK